MCFHSQIKIPIERGAQNGKSPTVWQGYKTNEGISDEPVLHLSNHLPNFVAGITTSLLSLPVY